MSIHIDPDRTPDRPKRTKIIKGVQSKSVPTAYAIPAFPPVLLALILNSCKVAFSVNLPAGGVRHEQFTF
jgi:hypothetical protein